MGTLLDAREQHSNRRDPDLGPRPELTIAILVDLGLSAERIGRYFQMPSAGVEALCTGADHSNSSSDDGYLGDSARPHWVAP